MDVVTLKNGAQEYFPLVNVLKILVKVLMDSDPIGFYELVSLARNKDHKVFGGKETLSKAIEFDLVNNVLQINKSVKNFLLSAVEGDGLEMKLVNPVKVD